MNILWHLLRADIRRARVLLVAWVLIVSAAAFLDGVQPLFAANAQLREWLLLAERLLWIAIILTMFVMIAWVIQAHPAVGSDAFWMTRPIPTSALVSSKLLLLAVAIMVVPTLAEAILLVAYDISFRPSAGVLAQRLINQTLWLTLLTIPAVLTGSLARYALVCASGLLIIIGAIALVTTISVASAGEEMMARLAVAESSDPFDPTDSVIFTLCFIVAGLALVITQYRRRSRVRSVLTGAAGVALAAAIASAWPWPFLMQTRRVPEWARDPAAVTLAVDTTKVHTNREGAMVGFDQEEPERAVVRAPTSVLGVAPGWMSSLTLIDAEVITREGARLTSEGGLATLVFGGSTMGYPSHTVLRDLLGVQFPSVGGGLHMGMPAALFVLPAADFARHTPTTGDYRGRFRVFLTRYEIDVILPLREQSRHVSGAHHLVIQTIRRRGHEMMVVAREARATSIWNRDPHSTYIYFLRNRRRGEAIPGGAFEMMNTMATTQWAPPMFSGASVGFSNEVSIGLGQHTQFKPRALMIGFPVGVPSAIGRSAIDEGWLNEAELVVVRETQEGFVERTLRISDFPLVPPITPQWDLRLEVQKPPLGN